MPNPTFEEVLEAVKPWDPAEQRQLRDLIHAWLASSQVHSPESRSERELQAELDRRLLEDGLLSQIPPPVTDFASFQSDKPVVIQGQPLSETIIEDRRMIDGRSPDVEYASRESVGRRTVADDR